MVEVLEEEKYNLDLEVKELKKKADKPQNGVHSSTKKNKSPSKMQSKIPAPTSTTNKAKVGKKLNFYESAEQKENGDQEDDDVEIFDEEFGNHKVSTQSPSKPADANDDGAPLEDEEDYSLVFPEQYHGQENEQAEIVQESEGTKGKKFRLYSNEKREILFTNGVRKEIFPDGYSIVYFTNDDIKQTYPDGRTVYYFADAGTAQTTMPDGLKIYKFNNDQIEKHYNDGTKEIIFPDGTVKYIFGQNDEESIFTDGTIQRLTPDGMKVVEYPSGQKDVIYPDGTKERQYATGKVKKMNPDGKIESYQTDQ